MKGISVDAPKIAAGLLAMVDTMPESYRSALGLGMLPAPLMDRAESMMVEKFNEIANARLGDGWEASFRALGCDELADEMLADLADNRKKWVRETMRAVSVEMLRQSSARGTTVV
jgi:hypothetical protein